jgi:hypothetical protein
MSHAHANPSLHKHRLGAGLVVAFGLLAALPAPAFADNAPDRQKAIGQPVGLLVQPASVTLVGPRSTQQLVVTGRYADGTIRDLTPYCDVTVEAGDLVAVDEGQFLLPRKNGSTNLVVTAGQQTMKVPVTVRDLEKARPTSFRHELIAVLNVGGCNQGACHGTPSGKNGFKLSLRGYDPSADYIQLTRDVLGRRSERQGPADSLMLLKALGHVAHEGGVRFGANSIPGKVMQAWLREGLQDDSPSLPPLKKIEVLPGSRVLNEPARVQQLAVLGHFGNGEVRDVTRLTVFSSSDTAIAGVNANGLVEFYQSGEVAILCRYLEELVPVRLTYLETKPGFKWTPPSENNFIDKHVFAKLKMLSILPSDLCTDQEFVRRAYMDLCGVLPTAEEARAFLDSKEPTRRAKLIDALLDRPEYSDFWTLKWSDVLRNTRKSVQLKGAYNFQKWIRSHIDKNTPFDVISRDLLTAEGNTFSNPPANYFRIARDPTTLAETTAQLFFGIRMQCAKCHNHPFERWTQDDYYSFAAFFARVKHRKDPYNPATNPQDKEVAEVIYLERSGEVTQPRTNQVIPAKFMGGAVAKVPPGKDRREVLATWLTAPDNPFFAKSVANRVWYHLLGRGVVDPVDDFRDSNPSANDELLDALARDFAAHKFDLKHLIRTIMNSRTYQLSAQSNDFNKEDNKYFSHAVTKLHTAEQLFDALCFVTEVPEDFKGFPKGTRAVQLPDGEVNHPFLKTFGQPARELACECEREGDSNLAQALQLINGPAVNDRLRNPANRIGKLLGKKLGERELLNELFLATLTRLPNDSEAKAMLDHVTRAMDKRKAWEDVHWALINSKEFLFRH